MEAYGFIASWSVHEWLLINNIFMDPYPGNLARNDSMLYISEKMNQSGITDSIMLML